MTHATEVLELRQTCVFFSLSVTYFENIDKPKQFLEASYLERLLKSTHVLRLCLLCSVAFCFSRERAIDRAALGARSAERGIPTFGLQRLSQPCMGHVAAAMWGRFPRRDGSHGGS